MIIDKNITIDLMEIDIKKAIAVYVERELQDDGVVVYIGPDMVVMTTPGHEIMAPLRARIVVKA